MVANVNAVNGWRIAKHEQYVSALGNRQIINDVEEVPHTRVTMTALYLPQLRELIERHGGQFAVVAAEDEDVAIDFVVEIAVEVERMPPAVFGDDRPDCLRVPIAKADLHLVGRFHAVPRLKSSKRF